MNVLPVTQNGAVVDVIKVILIPVEKFVENTFEQRADLSLSVKRLLTKGHFDDELSTVNNIHDFLFNTWP